jgi:hypothetical protein
MRLFGGMEGSVSHVIDWLTANAERTAILAVALGLLVGGTVFSLAETGVSFLDGIWWAFVSMTTVGYGDIAPQRPGIRMLATFVILCGIVATAILVGEITGRIAQRRIADAHRTEVLHDDLAAAAATLERVVPRLRALELDDADDPESWGRVRAIADRLAEGVSDPDELEALARELRRIARHELRA